MKKIGEIVYNPKTERYELKFDKEMNPVNTLNVCSDLIADAKTLIDKAFSRK